ncbi:MAG TPA: SAM-dependent chlorinase/fluorinase [Solirubrobacteraceae bacterium]|nr:SAM-dependent chlorinase/fluorinase [Solirubrobacteraceae bacterium]
MHSPLITFLSDYGQADEFVGVCHGVMARRCPEARIIDISHTIPRHDVREGAIVLRDALAHMPVGVHLAIVDPAIGSSRAARRAVALRTAVEDRLLVGPDNGLLWPAAARLGGAVEVVDIGQSPERRDPVSATFNGRDIFSPVAAALAAGESLTAVGSEIDVEDLRRLALPTANVLDDLLVAHMLRSDHFGNVILDATPEQLDEVAIEPGEVVSVEVAGRVYAGRYASTFADVPPGELLLYKDALEMAALAVNRGSASTHLKVRRDEELWIRRG